MRPRKRQRVAPSPHPGPVPKFMVPPGREGEPLTIVYGHNVQARKVLVQFTCQVERIYFDPAEARDMAARLTLYADMAEGKA